MQDSSNCAPTAVDSIIFGFENKELSLLLVRRREPPFMGDWSLMGGLVREDESLYQAAQRILFLLTGLKDIYLEQVRAFGDPSRDPTRRIISVAYYALISKRLLSSSDMEEFEARWFPIDQLPDLIFDHDEMVEAAKSQMKIQSILQPIGFKLLPDQFTIPDLQALYEAIFGRSLDPRNFRRRILSLGILNKLDVKKKTGSKKGAFLYEFDRQKYQRLVEETKSLSRIFRLF